MSDLRERADRAFEAALATLGDSPALKDVRGMLTGFRERLPAAMRVALVGRVSSGKSTLANAMLGAELAPTGVTELTFNVNWLRYGPERTLTVHFIDGRPPQRRDPAELAELTVRARDGDRERQALLRAIDYLEVTDPHEYLRDFDLIDTPGLDTAFGTEAQNTLRVVGRTGDDVRASSVAHAARADALVVVFSRGLAASEGALLDDFVHADFRTGGPIATIGALTKVELDWPEHPDPMVEGHRRAEVVMASAAARRVLFDLRPVASLLGAGAVTFTEDEYAALTALATVAPDTLARRLRRGPHFASRDYPDLPVAAPRRAALLRRFGRYGIDVACRLLRDGVDRPAALRAELTARSGMTDLKRLLVDHFGNRADLIKLRSMLDHAYRVRDDLAPRLDPRERMALLDAVAPLLALDHNEHAFRELDVLRQFYDDQLEFGDTEAADLMRVTGEYGTSVAARLGLPAEADRARLAASARDQLDRWARLDADPGYSGRSRRAVQVLRRTYEIIVDRTASGRAG